MSDQRKIRGWPGGGSRSRRGGAAVRRRSPPLHRAAIRRRRRPRWFGLVVIFALHFRRRLRPWLAPYGESEVVGKQYELWSDQFILGTDQFGRDMLSRLIYGARNSVGIALVTTLLSFSMGSLVGLLAAVVGGWLDQLSSGGSSMS